MATFTRLTGGISASATSVTSASISPTANRPVFAIIRASRGGGTAPTEPTVSGAGLTWAVVRSQTFTDGATETGRVMIYRGVNASPSSGGVTIDWGATTSLDIAYTLIDGEDCDAVVQSNSSSGTGTTASTTLSAWTGGTNLGLLVGGQIGGGAVTWTPEAGWTGFTQEAAGSRGAWREGEDTTPSITLSASAAWGIVACEVEAVSASGPTIDTQPVADVGLINGDPARRTTVYTVEASSAGTISALTWDVDGSPISDGGIYAISTTGIGTSSVSSTLTITRTDKTGTPFDINADVTDGDGTTSTNIVTDTWYTGPVISKTSGTTNGSGVDTLTITSDYPNADGEFTTVSATAGGVTKQVSLHYEP